MGIDVFGQIRNIVSEVFSKYVSSENCKAVLLNVNNDKIAEAFKDNVDLVKTIFLVRPAVDCRICRENLEKIGKVAFICKDGDNYRLVYPFEEILNRMDNEIADKTSEDHVFYNKVFKEILKLQRGSQIVAIPESEICTVPENEGVKMIQDKPVKFTFKHIYVPKIEGIRLWYQKKSIIENIVRNADKLEAAIETVKEILPDLYRGEQYTYIIGELEKLIDDYIKANDKELFIWYSIHVFKLDGNPLNTAIGLLIKRIAEGEDLDKAIDEYLRIVSPENYQQIKNKKLNNMQKKKFKEILEKEGLLKSLYRKVADIEEIPTSEFIYYNANSDRNKKDEVLKTLDELLKEEENTDVLEQKATEVEFDDIREIIRGAKKIELLLTENLIKNQVVLTKAKYKDSPILFKWGNNWSWIYKEGYSDATFVKSDVKRYGGNIDAELRISLWWNSLCDFDLHVIDPSGYHIYYADAKSPTGGELDVDMNVSKPKKPAIENVFWKESPPKGKYHVYIHNYTRREKNSGFIVEIEYKGAIYQFKYDEHLPDDKKKEVVDFVINKNGKLEITKIYPEIEPIKLGRNIWNSELGSWVEVKAILPSPNYWESGNKIGQEHMIFLIDAKLKGDEKIKPFTIDQIDNKYREHRKAFALLADNIPVETKGNPAVGLGFSRNRGETIYLRITDKNGNKKNYKVRL